MRRTRSRQARRSVMSGQTTPNRNGLVTDLDTFLLRLPKRRAHRGLGDAQHIAQSSLKCETAGRREIHRLRATSAVSHSVPRRATAAATAAAWVSLIPLDQCGWWPLPLDETPRSVVDRGG